MTFLTVAIVKFAFEAAIRGASIRRTWSAHKGFAAPGRRRLFTAGFVALMLCHMVSGESGGPFCRWHEPTAFARLDGLRRPLCIVHFRRTPKARRFAALGRLLARPPVSPIADGLTLTSWPAQLRDVVTLRDHLRLAGMKCYNSLAIRVPFSRVFYDYSFCLFSKCAPEAVARRGGCTLLELQLKYLPWIVCMFAPILFT
uniref:G-protein coupled receptors family 1 profile domain-containing protein n=1 Tax=Trichuris muris TaxID=70415 RepID=A0A5S6QVS0_TRIMR